MREIIFIIMWNKKKSRKSCALILFFNMVWNVIKLEILHFLFWNEFITFKGKKHKYEHILNNLSMNF
jgi:hypothetical protein